MLNKVLLMGRLTRDPELRTTPTGTPVCSFSIAVDRRYVKQGEERQTDFFNCVAWRTTAEFVNKFFTKGRMINVVGSIQNRSWVDNNGVKHYATDIVVDEANFCGEKRSDGDFGGGQSFSAGSSGDTAHDEGFVTVNVDDDLPF